MENLAEALALEHGAGTLTRYLRRAVPTPRSPHGARARYLPALSTRRRYANLAQ